MHKFKIFYALAVAIALGGCATPISNDLSPASAVASLLSQPIKDRVSEDMADTAYNLDQAQAIGIIASDSVLPACIHTINQQFGVEPNPSAAPVLSFKPKLGGLPASLGSVAYIDLLKLQKMRAAGISIPRDCVTAFGEMQLQGLGKMFSLFGGLPITIAPATPAGPAP